MYIIKRTTIINELNIIYKNIRTELNKIGLIIKDENAIPYGWGEAYLLQEVTENAYGELKPKNELIFTDIGYVPNQDNIIKQRINWNTFYGSLKPGKYRLVKPMYDPDSEGYINFMVGFEIN